MLPEARVNKAPSTEFSEISSQNPPLDPFRSLTPPKGSLSRSPPFPGDPSALRDPFLGLPPQCTSLDFLARFRTRSLWVPALVSSGTKVEPSSPTLSSPASQAPPGRPQGNPETPLPPSSQLRYRALTAQPAPPWGPPALRRGGGERGVFEMGRKASPSPTRGWKNQRGGIPEK